MTDKTRAIVLHQLKYSDSGIIVQLFTRKFGRQSVLIKGMRNKKAGKHNVFFQPLVILDLVMYYRESRAIQMLKEFSVSYLPAAIQADVKKSSMALFIGEVLTSVLKEESPNENLFDFIEESIIYFNASTEGFANFHIAFLVGLSSFLGFEPGKKSGKNDLYFDMLNGKFVPEPPLHGYYADVEISAILAAFFSSSYSSITGISLTGALRDEVLDVILKYYSLHLPGLKKVNSLDVLKEVFR
ncbi:MAG: DNA repair protein RecO [Bacteroidales bacterium]|nr:DNA repair protein RecO [Bacteroidales bacterium]